MAGLNGRLGVECAAAAKKRHPGSDFAVPNLNKCTPMIKLRIMSYCSFGI